MSSEQPGLVTNLPLLALVGLILGATLLIADWHGRDLLVLPSIYLIIRTLTCLHDAARGRGESAATRNRVVRKRQSQLMLALTLMGITISLRLRWPWVDLVGSTGMVAISLCLMSLEGHVSLARRPDPWKNPGWSQGLTEIASNLGLSRGGLHVATLVVLVACSFPIGTAYSVTALHADWPSLHSLRDATSPLAQSDRHESEDVTEGEVTLLPSVLASGATFQPVASPTIECALEPHSFFKALDVRQVSDALTEAWARYGSVEIGCPKKIVRQTQALIAVGLSGGQSDPSLVLSDRVGRAAVVFAPLVSQAKELLKTGLLRYAGSRISFGLGDYQIFHVKDSGCLLSMRSTYRSSYVHLPRGATHLLISEAIARGQFPFVLDERRTLRGEAFIVRFEGNRDDRLERIVVHKPDRASLASSVRKVNRSPDICPDVSAIELLAHGLERKIQRRG